MNKNLLQQGLLPDATLTDSQSRCNKGDDIGMIRIDHMLKYTVVSHPHITLSACFRHNKKS